MIDRYPGILTDVESVNIAPLGSVANMFLLAGEEVQCFLRVSVYFLFNL